MSWRESAHRHIAAAFEKVRREQPTLCDADVMKAISRDYYPFGERAMLPYKAWCQAIREWKAKLGIAVVEKPKKRKCGCWHKDGVVIESCAAHQSAWQGSMFAEVKR